MADSSSTTHLALIESSENSNGARHWYGDEALRIEAPGVRNVVLATASKSV
jgi:hypothetical protein